MITSETIRLIEERRNVSADTAKKIDRLLREPLMFRAYDDVQGAGRETFRLTPYVPGRVVEFKGGRGEATGG